MDGWTDGHVISEIYRLPLFLTHGAALSTLRAHARERALLKNIYIKIYYIVQPD